jgi:rhodanese-related sulfurtransferase
MKYILMIALVIGGLFMFMQNGNANQTMKYEELQNKLNAQENFVLLDVRTQEEFDAGHIAGAILLPYDEINLKAATVLPDKEKEIVLYCRSGRRSAIAKKALVELGYKDVEDFGGINRWKGELVK